MAVVISDAILEQAEVTGEDLIIDLSCYLFDKKRLSLGKARALAGLDLLSFQRELSIREIDMHYDENDLELDLKNLNISL